MGDVVIQKKLREERRVFAYWFLGNKCAKCGKGGKLDFDHIDPSTKEHEISSLLSSAFLTLMAELAKCQLLCKRCHIAKTKVDNGQPQEPLHGTLTRATHYKCTCSLCRATLNQWTKEYRWRTGKRKERVLAPDGHGTRKGYRNGCRCDLCTKAQRDYQREWSNRTNMAR